MFNNRLLSGGALALTFGTLSLAVPLKNSPIKTTYVIIGSGPAGFVLSEYLTRDANVTVILLETGNDEDDSPNINGMSKSSSLVGFKSLTRFTSLSSWQCTKHSGLCQPLLLSTGS